MALTGKELLNKVAGLGADAPKDVVAREAGYVQTKKDGTERILYSAFYEALLQAKGLALAPATSNRPGRELSYVARVQKNGNLIVSGGYTALQNLQPGDEFEIEELEGGGYSLRPYVEEAAAA